ncbi:MAG: hypothetical protein WBW04_09400 [Nitrolancea sp.]
MANSAWSLSVEERSTLERVLDALLPPTGSFPLPSQTNMIDEFILKRIPEVDERGSLYPGLDSSRLKALLGELAGDPDMTESLSMLQNENPTQFQAVLSLAVYGYYSRAETITAIQRDLAPAYHGAPLPLGYAGAMAPWDANDPLQMPRSPRGSYVPTNQVKRVDLSRLDVERRRS